MLRLVGVFFVPNQYLEDFLLVKDIDPAILALDEEPVMKVSVERLSSAQQSFVNVIQVAQVPPIISRDNFGLGRISHRVNISLLDI